MHKTIWVDSTLGSPDWTVLMNAYTVHVVPDWIMQLIHSFIHSYIYSTTKH